MNWTTCPVSKTNAGGSVPDDGSAYLALEFPAATEELASFGSPGSNVFREEGAFRLILSAPIGDTLIPYDEWIETLRALFRFQQFSGVTTWAAGPPSDDGDSENGAYFEISFSVAYRFDLIA